VSEPLPVNFLSLTSRCGPLTFDDMKEAVLTIRMGGATRRRLEILARREGRSLSAQAERLIEQGLARPTRAGANRRGVRPLAGRLRGGVVPTLAEFREVRAMIAASILRRTRAHAAARR
jgi:predicted transcriptional regulator